MYGLKGQCASRSELRDAIENMGDSLRSNDSDNNQYNISIMPCWTLWHENKAQKVVNEKNRCLELYTV